MNRPAAAARVALTAGLVVAAASLSNQRLSAQIAPHDSLANRVATTKLKRKPDRSDEFFRRGEIPQLKIEIPPGQLDRLRQNHRQYVRAKLTENGRTEYQSVGIKLKGAAGSFRDIDDRPALTLNFDKFKEKQRFHDLDKIHLNNSVQDPTYLNELICSELFLAAGVPTPRTTHARVWLNGRDLGFYVLKEGFDQTFLKRHFKDAAGNLYDSGLLQEIDNNLEKDSGGGPDDHSDLRALADAARDEDAARRWRRIDELLDVDQFLTFMALELMCSHWDGYCNARNNYRVYFDPTAKRWHFFPHGMDQMFGDPNADILGTPGALVSQAVLSNPQWRGQYRDRIAELLAMFSPPDRLLKRIDGAHARIRPVLAAMDQQQAREHDEQVKQLKERIIERAGSLERQNSSPEPRPLRFDDRGVATVAGWKPRLETDDAKLDEIAKPGESAIYSIACGPGGRCVASWRAKVLLPAGKYKFAGKVRTAGVAPSDDPAGSGAGLRISGGKRTNKLSGDSNWQKLEHELEVTGALVEVELVAELRATKGQAWFDAKSLVLVRLEK
jgi:spore coat protein CotH